MSYSVLLWVHKSIQSNAQQESAKKREIAGVVVGRGGMLECGIVEGWFCNRKMSTRMVLSNEMELLYLSNRTQCVSIQKDKVDRSGQNTIDVHEP